MNGIKIRGRDVWRRAPTVDGSAALSGDMLDPYASKIGLCCFYDID